MMDGTGGFSSSFGSGFGGASSGFHDSSMGGMNTDKIATSHALHDHGYHDHPGPLSGRSDHGADMRVSRHNGLSKMMDDTGRSEDFGKSKHKKKTSSSSHHQTKATQTPFATSSYHKSRFYQCDSEDDRSFDDLTCPGDYKKKTGIFDSRARHSSNAVDAANCCIIS